MGLDVVAIIAAAAAVATVIYYLLISSDLMNAIGAKCSSFTGLSFKFTVIGVIKYFHKSNEE